MTLPVTFDRLGTRPAALRGSRAACGGEFGRGDHRRLEDLPHPRPERAALNDWRGGDGGAIH